MNTTQYEIKDIQQGVEHEIAGASGKLFMNGIEIGKVIDLADGGPFDIVLSDEELTEIKLFAMREWPSVEEFLEYLIDKAVN